MAKWTERQRNLIDFTLSSLKRRKGKNLSLLAVYTIIVFVLASAMFFIHAMKREAVLLLQGSPEMIVQRVLAGRHDLIPSAYAKIVAGIRGVGAAEERLWGYLYDPVVGANYTLMVSRHSSPASGSIVIGKGISRQRMVFEGDILSFRAHDGRVRSFRVQGIMPSESELVSADLILMAEKDFRGLFGVPVGYATDLAVTVRNPQELVTIARKISETLPDTRPIIRDEMVRTYDAVFNWRGGMIMILLVSTVLSFAILVWEKASGLSAEERREIGILKAIGWETSDVIFMKVWEGVAMSFFSFSLGILLAYVHVFFGSALIFAPALKGWSTLYPDFRLTPFVDPYQIGVLFFLTVVPYTVAAMAPAWRAAIVDPDTIMRS